MRSGSVSLLVGLLLTSCLDLVLPPDGTKEAGEVALTVLVQRPGRPELQPAPGATLALAGTSLSATADGDGNVKLGGLTTSVGVLRLEWDGDGDGLIDAARLFDLQAIGAGFGRRVSLGVVVLGRLATVQGKALRGDRAASATGHGGIQVFVPASPSSAVTSDDGSYTLNGLPEGNLPVTAYAPGYAPASSRVTVTAGQTVQLENVVLQPAPVSETGRLKGTVRDSGGTPLQAVDVTAETSSGPLRTTTGAIGGWELADVPPGLVNLVFKKGGFVSVRIPNFLVQAGLSTQDVTLTAGVDPADPPPAPDAGVVDAGAVDAGVAAPPVLRGAGPVQLVGGSLPDGGTSFVGSTAALEGDLDFIMLKYSMGMVPAYEDPWTLVYSATEPFESPLRFLTRRAGAGGGGPVEFSGRDLRSGLALTYANASQVRVSFGREITASASPPADPRIPGVRARPGDLVLNVSTTAGFPPCSANDGGIELVAAGDFLIAAVQVPDSGVTEPVLIECSSQSNTVLLQFVISGAP